jgi:signal transduction histidine kinase
VSEQEVVQRDRGFFTLIALELTAVAVGISLLEALAGWQMRLINIGTWAGEFRWLPTVTRVPLPGIGAILMYLALGYLQPRLWPRHDAWRMFSGLAFVLTALAIAFLLPFWRLGALIMLYGVLAHGRVTYGARTSRFIAAALVAGVAAGALLGQFVSPIHLHGMVSAGADMQGISPLQFGIWLIGLIFVLTFTGAGACEREARVRAEGLVCELLLAQAQLRHYAAGAAETATLRERARVAREIHDTLAQGLAAIVMQLDTGAIVAASDPAAARTHMQAARDLAQTHLAEARHAILDLRDATLADRPLPVALDALACRWITPERAVVVRLAADLDAAALPPTLAAALYRIVCEALANAVHHGHARRIVLELSREGDDLCLTVTDDGAGFDPAAPPIPPPGHGFGLRGMQERARLLGGRLEILSAPGAGTQVAAMLPLPAASVLEEARHG